ncbi:MAG: TolB family protein [Pyrinomonadaceae bacterium]
MLPKIDFLFFELTYFSSNRAGGLGLQDIYFSVDSGLARLAPGLSTAFNDVRPYVRKDGREIVFDSNRPGSFGLQDIYTASRETTADDWSTPTNLGPLVNSSAMEARATLSRDGLTMFFGSNRAGSDGLSDIYMTSREKRADPCCCNSRPCRLDRDGPCK